MTGKPSSMNMLKIVEVPNPGLAFGQATSVAQANDSVNMSVDFPPLESPEFNSVVTLNVGGTIVTTSLATLRKYPDSMLAVMFSGRHHLATDEHGRFAYSEQIARKKGHIRIVDSSINSDLHSDYHTSAMSISDYETPIRYFIDRDGELFMHILNFLRQNKTPPLSVALDVYEEAQYYNVLPLISILSRTRPVAGDKIKRLFLDKVPNYEGNIELLIDKAQKLATEHPDRVTKLHVCVFKEESPISPYENSLLPLVPGERNPNHYQKSHRCDVSLTFGPWDTAPDVYDLIHCIQEDVMKRGFSLDCQCIGVCDQHLTEQFYCKRPIYEFKFKWW